MDNAENQQKKPLAPERTLSQDSTKSKEAAQRRASRWKRLTIYLIAVNIICLFALLTIAIIWTTQHGQPDPINKDQEFCIDCSKVNNKTEGYDVIKTNNQCCGSADKIVEDLVHKKLSENYQEDESRDPFYFSRMQCGTDHWEKRPATRIVGLSHRTESNSNELQWGKNEKLTFQNHHIEYRDGKLVPVSQGTYYLYSQITVNLNRSFTSPISHTMYRLRSRDKVSEQLLEGVISNCQLSVNSSDSTSYLGATFMLDAKDEIAVKITHPDMIKYDSDAGNYFGMHKI